MDVGTGDHNDEAPAEIERRIRTAAVERTRRMVADGEIDLSVIEKPAD
ncbi:hypothetical protein QQY66_15005 [Streptomyces sp. DG2A-72]|nr:hypothetical protein [Streptomyces sp. DG2A-72]MDO0932937.1 hypothetical protein [Streptomyces sp. DG2A-72]